MNYLIVAVTRRGVELGKKIAGLLPDATLFTTLDGQDGATKINGSLGAFIGEYFHTVETLVFIAATGIAVRCIAPCLRDKMSDPGVVAIDELGRFVISLLSGHVGGANEETLRIAEFLNATPVITTASDGLKMESVDMIAKRDGLAISDLDAAKRITALMVNGAKVGFYHDFSGDCGDNAGIIDVTVWRKNYPLPAVRLIPPLVIAGIGCRRGISGRSLIEALQKEFDRVQVDMKSLRALATVTLKADEEGIKECAELLKVPVLFYTPEELQNVADHFDSSPFVKKTVGVGAVCEPAAFLAAGADSRFLSNKQIYKGITIALCIQNRME